MQGLLPLPVGSSSPEKILSHSQRRRSSLQLENRQSLLERLAAAEAEDSKKSQLPDLAKTVQPPFSRGRKALVVAILSLIAMGGVLVAVGVPFSSSSSSDYEEEEEERSSSHIRRLQTTSEDTGTSTPGVLNGDDTAAWKSLYQLLNLKAWVSSSVPGAFYSCPAPLSFNANPCGCSFRNGNVYASVQCTGDGTAITSFQLYNFTLASGGVVLSSSVLTTFSRIMRMEIVPAPGTIINGDGTWRQAPGAPLCVKYLPRCELVNLGTTCVLPMPYCSSTGWGAWDALRSYTGGTTKWTRCGTAADPCSCAAGATCVYGPHGKAGGPVGLSAVTMANSNMWGIIPGAELTAGLATSPLNLLDLSGNPNLRGDDFGQFACAHLPKCDDGSWGDCRLPVGVKLCGSESDLGAWWAVFDAFTGLPPGCSRSNPCGGSCPTSIISCLDDRITRLNVSGATPVRPLPAASIFLRLTALNSVLALPSTTSVVGGPDACLLSPPACTTSGGRVVCLGPFCGSTIQQGENSVDLATWQRFFDVTDGANWTTCFTSRDDPCGKCSSRVTCRAGDGALLQIDMSENNLRGTLPDDLIPAFVALTFFDVSDNPDLVLDLGTGSDGTPPPDSSPPPCYTLEYCARPGVVCDFGAIPLCTDNSPSPTRAPTSSPTTVGLVPQDLNAWHEFYDAMGGHNWYRCAALREDPCACKSTSKSVRCDRIDGVLRITGIDLGTNKMSGVITPELFRAFTALTSLTLSNKPPPTGKKTNFNSFRLPAGTSCLNLQPECGDKIYTSCGFAKTGVVICAKPPTAKPTRGPTTSSPVPGPLGVCETDGGFAASESLCATNYKVNGKGPFNGCLSTAPGPNALLPYMGTAVDIPREPTLFNGDKSGWCPTVKAYKSPSKAWGYCRCRAPPTPAPTTPQAPPTLTLSPTPTGGVIIESPTAPTVLQLYDSDLTGWRLFYDALDGPDWVGCSDRNFPCIAPNCQSRGTREVVCEPDKSLSALRIVSIALKNNNLVGVLPSAAINMMGALRFLDLGNIHKVTSNRNTLSVPPGVVCVPAGLCLSGACHFANTDINEKKIQYCPTAAPSHAPLRESDLEVWQMLWEATAGPRWAGCSSRDDPCGLGKCSSSSLVECLPAEDGSGELRITRVVLRNKNLVGAIPDLSAWDALRELDLSNAKGVKKPINSLTGCVRNAVCSPTSAPTKAPSPVAKATRAPTVFKPVCNLARTKLTVCPPPPTNAPTLPRTYVLDNEAFLTLRDATGGDTWAECATATDACADCSAHVTCALFQPGPTLRITGLDLFNNRLKGTLPSWRELNPLGDATLFHLKHFSVANRANRPKSVSQAQWNARKNVLTTVPGKVCVDYPLCGSTPSACAFGDTGVGACKVAHPDDAAMWAFLYDRLQGARWLTCSQDRDSPCACVPCDAQGRITKIVLPDNDMVGIFPFEELQSNPSLFPKLTVLDLSTTDPLDSATRNLFLNASSPCARLDRCWSGGMTCNFAQSGVTLCAKPPANTLSPTSAPGGAGGGTLPVRPADLVVWWAIFDAMGGTSWSRCAGGRNAPCDPYLCGTSTVQCIPDATDTSMVVLALKLDRIGLDGWFPDAAVESLADLEYLDLSNLGTGGKSNVVRNSVCLNLQRCYTTVDCRLDGLSSNAQLCIEIVEGESHSPTPVPTIATPAPTSKPTIPTKAPVPTRLPTSIPTSPTKTPTSLPSLPPRTFPADLTAFRLFFDSLRGTEWVTCNTSRADPCDETTNGCDPTQIARRRIVCDVDSEGNIRILEVKLQNNRLRGYLPAAFVSGLPMMSLMDLSNTPTADATTANVLYNTDCLYAPQCLSGGGTYCSLSGTGHPGLCANPPLPTPVPSTPSPTPDSSNLAPGDLAAWQALWDALGGPSWVACGAGYRNAPCGGCGLTVVQQLARRVSCEVVGSVLRIVEIKLPDNAMAGFLPANAIQALSAMNYLSLDSVSGNATLANAFFNPTCVVLPRCFQTSEMYCSMKGANTAGFCAGTPGAPTPPPTLSTASPTAATAGVPQLASVELTAWRSFFDATRGFAWRACNTSREDPCAKCAESLQQYVSCVADGGDAKTLHIGEVVLRNNRLFGTVNVTAVNQFTALSFLDLRNTGSLLSDANVFLNSGCLSLPVCKTPQVACLFDGTSASLC